MLVLARRWHEEVMIGEDVTVTVLEITGNTVRLGITAPRSTPVHRKEIYNRIQREKLLRPIDVNNIVGGPSEAELARERTAYREKAEQRAADILNARLQKDNP